MSTNDLIDIPQPRKYPAKLSRFLRLVAKAKSEGEGLKLLRQFYYEEHVWRYCRNRRNLLTPNDEETIASEVDHEIAGWRKKQDGDGKKMSPPFTREKWMNLAQRFLAWRKADKSKKAKMAAASRKVFGRKKAS